MVNAFWSRSNPVSTTCLVHSRGMKGLRITSDQEIKDALQVGLAAQQETFFSEGIRQLVQRWTKCVEKHGDYIEK